MKSLRVTLILLAVTSLACADQVGPPDPNGRDVPTGPYRDPYSRDPYQGMSPPPYPYSRDPYSSPYRDPYSGSYYWDRTPDWYRQLPPPPSYDAVQPLDVRIYQNLAKHSTIRKKLNDIHIYVYGSTVVVSGVVDNETQRSTVLAVVKQTNGVIYVDDQLNVRSNPRRSPSPYPYAFDLQ